MKKICFTLVVISSVLIFASCKKTSGPSSPSDAIVGTWEVKTSVVIEADSTTTPATVVETDSTYTHGHTLIAIFKSDSTFTETDYSTTPATSIAAGTYSLDHANGNITLVSPTVGETDQYRIVGNTLTISEFLSQAGEGSLSVALVFAKQ